MKRSEYELVTKTISKTISFLNRGSKLGNDDIDDIKNQVLLKLTPQLKKILNFERLHLVNFVRKTTRCVFWDYLKSMSCDLTNYRVKKRIKDILANLEEVKSQFKKPDNDTPWYINRDAKEPNREITDPEKRLDLERIVRKWKMNSPSPVKSFTADESLTDLVKAIFKQADFGISVNDIFYSLSSVTDIEEIARVPLEMTGPGGNDDGGVNRGGTIRAEEIPAEAFGVDELIFYKNYAQEFLENHVTGAQTRMYYLRFVANLGYKEIEKKYHINIKTAESRLSIKPDKKGFLWRLAEFIKELGLNIEESGDFVDIMNRKIRESNGNILLKKKNKNSRGLI